MSAKRVLTRIPLLLQAQPVSRKRRTDLCRISGMLMQFAAATAAKGTKRPMSGDTCCGDSAESRAHFSRTPGRQCPCFLTTTANSGSCAETQAGSTFPPARQRLQYVSGWACEASGTFRQLTAEGTESQTLGSGAGLPPPAQPLVGEHVSSALCQAQTRVLAAGDSPSLGSCD